MAINNETNLITVLVLGGYGNFGKRIVENLSQVNGIQILIAGRHLTKASALVNQLKPKAVAQLKPIVLDIFSSDFAATLIELAPYLVIHTSGPFQEQPYLVPQACINANAHYIDLADDRRFVCDVTQLNEAAKEKNILVISGASSVPGLSSAVIDHFHAQFSEINSIDIAIAPGNKAERGEATVHAILSYTGHAFKAFQHGQWQDIFGWMNPRKIDFGDIIGQRWLANVDVPDLELFPNRYQVTDFVRFQAGLELTFLHLTMVGMAYLAKKRIVKNWKNFTRLIVKASNLLMPFGSDKGAMQVTIIGRNHQNQLEACKWTLIAPNGIGPYIPTLSTIIIANKLINAKLNASNIVSNGNQTSNIKSGAMACIGQFCLEDFFPYFENLGIYHQVERQLVQPMKEQLKGQTIG